MNNLVALTIPAKRDMILVARMTTAGVLTRIGMSLDILEDMKMAAEESCQCMMSQSLTFEKLELEFTNAQREISISVTGIDGVENTEPAVIEPFSVDIVRCVLESMTDYVELSGTEGRLTRIKVTKRLAAD